MLRRFSILAFAFALVLGACGDDGTAIDSTATTAAVMDDMHADDGDAHAEGDEHSAEDHSDDADAHDDADEHSADDHGDEVMAVSEEYIPEAIGEVEVSFTIEMHDFGFEAHDLELAPGMTVELILVNEGLLIHEFRLTTGERAAKHVAEGHADHGSEGDEGHDADKDIIVNVEPGSTRTVVMTLPEHGEFDHVACLIPGHYEAGMFLEI